MVRYDDAVSAYIGRGPGILRIQNTLDDQRPVPARSDPVKILPEDGRIEISAEPAHVVIKATGFTQHGLEIAELMRTAIYSHIPRPAWLSRSEERLVGKEGRSR